MPNLALAIMTDGLAPFVMGGIQRHSVMLAEAFAKLGSSVTVYHTARGGAPSDSARRLEGFESHPWENIDAVFVEPPPARKFPGHYVYEAWAYSRALLERYQTQAKTTDIIYAQGLTGLAFVEAKRHGAPLPPIVVNLHGYEMFQRPATFRTAFEQWVLRPPANFLTTHADRVVSFPGRIRDLVAAKFPSRVDALIEAPNAIPDTWLANGPTPCRSPRRFLFVGRFERRKGLMELHEAISRQPELNAEFHFIGDIPTEKRLSGEQVVYHGMIKEADRLIGELDAADILVCPSYAEGMPTVILEAMARGLAVIATDVGAVGSIVDSGNGVLLPAPRVELLAEAICTLGQMPCDNLQQLKAASLARARSYAWSAVALRLRDEFLGLTKANDSTSSYLQPLFKHRVSTTTVTVGNDG